MRVQLTVLVVSLLVLCAVPFYLVRRPRSPALAELSDAGLALEAFDAGPGAAADAAAAPTADTGAPSFGKRVTLGEPKVVIGTASTWFYTYEPPRPVPFTGNLWAAILQVEFEAGRVKAAEWLPRG